MSPAHALVLLTVAAAAVIIGGFHFSAKHPANTDRSFEPINFDQHNLF